MPGAGEAMGWGEGVFHRDRASVWEDEKVPETDGGHGILIG